MIAIKLTSCAGDSRLFQFTAPEIRIGFRLGAEISLEPLSSKGAEIRLRETSPGNYSADPVVLPGTFVVKGKAVDGIVSLDRGDVITAGDIGKFLNGFQVLNPELVVAHCEPSVKLKLEITIEKGRGYVPADENKPANAAHGVIPVDAIFTPIRNVKYAVENYRVEQKTDYEKLVVDIVTDGSIHPKDALKEAAKILIHHFMLFSDERITLDTEEKSTENEFDEASLHMRQLLKTKLVDMDLSVRALNCLKAADVETLGELVAFNKNDLLKFRNFGKKSLTELEDLVTTKGLQFGMNVSKYKLDKE
jgi:DNA-directed RNA polymerase subunit alpha